MHSISKLWRRLKNPLRFEPQLGQIVEQLVAEDQPVAAAATEEIADFVVGDAAGPTDKIAIGIELRPLLPQNEAGLLEHVLGVVAVGQQRGDVAVHPILVQDERLGELFVLFRVHHRRQKGKEAAVQHSPVVKGSYCRGGICRGIAAGAAHSGWAWSQVSIVIRDASGHVKFSARRQKCHRWVVWIVTKRP